MILNDRKIYTKPKTEIKTYKMSSDIFTTSGGDLYDGDDYNIGGNGAKVNNSVFGDE